MTDHNATWSEEMYYSEDNEIDLDDEDPDPRGHTSDKSGYWDYKDE